MKRQRCAVRVIAPALQDGGVVYHDKTVIAVVGGGRPINKLKEVIHGTYALIDRLSVEAIDDGVEPPRHDKVYVDPSDWTYHYLRRIS